MKNELLISLIDGDIVENEELNLRSDNVAYCQEAIPIVKEWDNYQVMGVLQEMGVCKTCGSVRKVSKTQKILVNVFEKLYKIH